MERAFRESGFVFDCSRVFRSDNGDAVLTVTSQYAKSGAPLGFPRGTLTYHRGVNGLCQKSFSLVNDPVDALVLHHGAQPIYVVTLDGTGLNIHGPLVVYKAGMILHTVSIISVLTQTELKRYRAHQPSWTSIGALFRFMVIDEDPVLRVQFPWGSEVFLYLASGEVARTSVDTELGVRRVSP